MKEKLEKWMADLSVIRVSVGAVEGKDDMDEGELDFIADKLDNLFVEIEKEWQYAED